MKTVRGLYIRNKNMSEESQNWANVIHKERFEDKKMEGYINNNEQVQKWLHAKKKYIDKQNR